MKKFEKYLFKTTLPFIVVSVTLTALTEFILVLLLGVERLSDLLFVFVIPVAIFSAIDVLICYRLSKQAALKLKENVSAFNFEHPELSNSFEELNYVKQELIHRNERISAYIKDMDARHNLRDTMRSEFTANISHELKTPLTSISGYAEIIKEGIAQGDDVIRFSSKIYDESQRLITLVGDIIKLSQLDSGEFVADTEQIDLYSLCEAVMARLDLAVSEAQLNVSIEGEHIQIVGIRRLAEEIIFNVCDNAVKYNKKGGSVQIKLKQCFDGAQLTVKDTGIGIPEESLHRIFERFYRVDKSHSKQIGGTGLGLSIVKHAARILKAEVTLESQIDVGTTVRILF